MNESQPGSLREKQGSEVLAPAAKEEIRKHVKDLLSDDFSVRAASMTSLEKYGSAAAEAIVDALVKKPESQALTNFSGALAEIGKPSLNVILHALNHIVEVKRLGIEFGGKRSDPLAIDLQAPGSELLPGGEFIEVATRHAECPSGGNCAACVRMKSAIDVAGDPVSFST